MAKFKTKAGDLVGPYNILFKEELPSKTRHRGAIDRVGIFVCPECGKTFTTLLKHVISGATRCCKECGLKHRSGRNNPNFIDLTGEKIGKLTVIEPVGVKTFGKSANGHIMKRIMWRCKCDCGNELEVDSNLLSQKLKNSCGKCNYTSNGEWKIDAILKSLNIKYQPQKIFKDCLTPNSKMPCRFDFYLIDYNICIEYDGISHYKANPYGSWNTEESVKQTQYRDSIKNKYCLDNNIPLIRIPYWDFDKLNEDYLMSLINEKLNH